MHLSTVFEYLMQSRHVLYRHSRTVQLVASYCHVRVIRIRNSTSIVLTNAVLANRAGQGTTHVQQIND